MTSIIIVETNGSLKQTKVKDISYDTLYKKCGFKVPTEFDKRTTWNKTINNEQIIIELWAKENGKANNENKFDFPPPIDKTLFFGNCALVRINPNNEIIDLDTPIWNKMYEKLFGGFHDLVNEEDDELSEDELKTIDKKYKTKHGYLKDGFIVDSGENSNDENDENIYSENDDDSYLSGDSDNDSDTGGGLNENNNNTYDGSELEESDYIYSDDDDCE
jgi:hypothetical protein